MQLNKQTEKNKEKDFSLPENRDMFPPHGDEKEL